MDRFVTRVSRDPTLPSPTVDMTTAEVVELNAVNAAVSESQAPHSTKKRPYATDYSPEFRAKVGRHALHCGPRAAERAFRVCFYSFYVCSVC